MSRVDLIHDSEETPRLTVRVCDGIACELANSKKIYTELSRSLPDDINVIHAPCIGRCEQAPAAVVQNTHGLVRENEKKRVHKKRENQFI